MNTNVSENSGITVETSRAISSEISSQMSKKFEEMQTNLNSQILDIINAAIETKVLPSIKNIVKSQNSAKITNLDLRSDRPHPSNSSQARPQKDLQSNGLHPENVSNSAGDAENDFPSLVSMKSNRINHCRENFMDSNQGDDETGYDRDGLFYFKTQTTLSTFASNCLKTESQSKKYMKHLHQQTPISTARQINSFYVIIKTGTLKIGAISKSANFSKYVQDVIIESSKAVLRHPKGTFHAR